MKKELAALESEEIECIYGDASMIKDYYDIGTFLFSIMIQTHLPSHSFTPFKRKGMEKGQKERERESVCVCICVYVCVCVCVCV